MTLQNKISLATLIALSIVSGFPAYGGERAEIHRLKIAILYIDHKNPVKNDEAALEMVSVDQESFRFSTKGMLIEGSFLLDKKNPQIANVNLNVYFVKGRGIEPQRISSPKVRTRLGVPVTLSDNRTDAGKKPLTSLTYTVIVD